MGCGSSKDVMTKIEDQEKKIDNLIQINKELEQKLNELQMNNGNEARHNNDKSISKNDLTNLKTTIDSRFSKLEKNVEKIHNEFKLKLFEGIIDNINGDEGNNNPNESLDLNYAKETGQNNYQAKRATYEKGAPSVTSHNQIKLDLNRDGKNFDLSANQNIKSLAETGKGILDDEEIKRVHAQVKNTLFKGNGKP